MLSVPTVHPDDGGLVTIKIGIHGRSAECLCPISGKPFSMLGVKAMAERMGYHVVSHHPMVPGVSKTAQAIDAPGRLENSFHTVMMTILRSLIKMRTVKSCQI